MKTPCRTSSVRYRWAGSSPPEGPKSGSGSATAAASTAAPSTSPETRAPRVPGMARAAALALLIFSFMVGDAQATQIFRVYAVDRPLQNIPGGAEGLLVPGAGPETSFDSATAELARGEVENSLRGGMPEGAPLIRLSPPAENPKPPYILVSVPQGGKQANDRRYPVVVVGKGFDGILRSDSTRIPGLVSVADIAPTAPGGGGGKRLRGLPPLGSHPDPRAGPGPRHPPAGARTRGDPPLAASMRLRRVPECPRPPDRGSQRCPPAREHPRRDSHP